ncbi:MAG: DUF881 domain-containing protein [Marmoricola sp.]
MSPESRSPVSGSEDASGDGPAARLPPQATMGLLDYLTSHALDEDYAHVAMRDADRGAGLGEGGPASPADPPASPPRRRVGVVGALVMAVFAVLVVTAAAQTSRNSVSDESQRRDLAAQVSDARAQLDAERTRVNRLQRETTALQTSQLENDQSAQGLLDRLDLLRVKTGATPVRGPGVRVVANDAPGATTARNEVLDTDLQRLVNGLWEAGAEAIALNGQRLTNLSTIRQAGGAITTNGRSLRPPYVLDVIGNKDTLPARFAETTSGQAWLDLQRQVGLELTITPRDSLRLPASEVSLRYANQPSGGPP